jgi:hypothetical protein
VNRAQACDDAAPQGHADKSKLEIGIFIPSHLPKAQRAPTIALRLLLHTSAATMPHLLENVRQKKNTC